MGKNLISTIKRAGYFGVAGALVLTAMPVMPIASAWAESGDPFCVEGGTCYDTLQKAFDAVPSNGTETRIYLNSSENTVSDGGAKLQAGQNVLLDLKGKTYDVSENTVGSTGTETQAFQLLKGSTFTLRNGTITASAADAKIWIQNYADTTLEDVVLDATDYSQVQYVVSNNFGTLNVKGDTEIIANENGVAFDLWYGMSSVYDDGVTVNFGSDFTGKVEGKIEYGAARRAQGMADWQEKAELNISGGTFDVTFAEGSTGALEGANINIGGSVLGGDFTNFPTNVDVDRAVYKNADGTYEVADAPDMSELTERMFAKVGEATVVEGLTDEILEHSTVSVTTLGTFADGKITATGVGTFDIIIQPEIYKKDGDTVVRDTSYDERVKVHSYDFKDVEVVLPVGDTEVLAVDTVKVDETYDKFEYSVENTAVATINEDGEIEAVASGQTDVYATVGIKNRTENVKVKIGIVNVYDFSSIEDSYLIKKKKSEDILTDSSWNVVATTAETDVVGLTEGTNSWTVKGLDVGKATVTFTATIGDKEQSKTSTVHVYDVVDKNVIVEKGETVTADKLAEMVPTDDEVLVSVKKIADTSIASTDNATIMGVEPGQTTATYRLSVGDSEEKHATVTLNVHVWDFVTEDLADEYDLGDLKTVTDAFKVYDNGGEISYTVKDENGEEVDDVIVNSDGDGYTITKADNAEAGEYSIEFVDTVMGKEVASKTVTVRVHEITLDPSEEQYIVMSAKDPLKNEFDLTVSEKNNYSEISDIQCQANTLQGISLNATDAGFKVMASEAGAYSVTCDDGVASRSIDVYVIDFTVDKMSYHLVAGDTTLHLVEAINEYWNKTEKGEATDFKVWKNTDREYAIQLNEDTQAGDYTVEFYAYANGAVRQTRVVKVFVYEMEAPAENLYIGEVGDEFSIEVKDKNTHAYTRAKIIDGSKKGLKLSDDYTKVEAMRPGVYTVRYTDYMGNGKVVGTYDATIIVIEVEEEELFVRKGETVELDGNKDWSASFATDDTTGVDYEAEDGAIKFDTTDMELGVHEVYIAHDFAEFDEGEFPPRELVKATTVVVYDVTGDESDDMTSDDDRASVADFVAEHIAEMIENDATSGDEQILLDATIDELKDLLREGVEITTALEVNLIDEADWEYDAEAYDEVVLKVEDESGIVAMYEAYLGIYANGDLIGLVYELDDAITMRLLIPEEYRSAADGYTRTFTLVRGHEALDGTETAEVIDVTRDGDYLVFKNDKFSSFAISYTDTLIPTAPDTGLMISEKSPASVSSSLVALTAMVMGTLIMAGAVVFAKRK